MSLLTTHGQATSANSAPVVISLDQTSLVPSPRASAGIITTPAQQKLFRCSFAKTLSGTDGDFFETVVTGSGQGVSQGSGNLLITSGTISNAETILRSTNSFVGNTISRIQISLSQRIINQQFFVELVDRIGDNLEANMTSATTLQVTIPSNPFTAENIGQSMYVGNIDGAGLTGVPGRYTISAVAGNNVTFTVSGFSIANGTVSLFGWNYYHTIYDGASAVAYKYDSQRKGWNSGDVTIGNANTSNSPGHILIMGNEDGNAWVTDQSTVTGSGNFNSSVKAQRFLNLADEEVDLYLQIRCVNGSTAPASTTTLTVGMVSIENYSTTPVSSYNVKPQGPANAMPVNLVTGVTANILSGQTAHSTAATGSPLRVGGKVATALDTTLVNGDVSDMLMTSAGQFIQKPYGSAENDWQYAAAASGIVNTTTAVIIKAAGAAGIRNYITGITLMADALGAATELVIRDGAAGTVLFRIRIPTTGLVTNQINFPTPLKGTAATLLEIATLTASVTGSVYVNAQGYQSA